MSQHKPKQKTASKTSSRKPAPGKVSAGLMPWLITIGLALPLIYSGSTLDPVVSVRYLLYCIFTTAFAAYFLFFKSRKYPFPSTFLTTLVFGVLLLYCITGVIALFSAINKNEGFMEASRNFMNLLFLGIVLLIVYYDSDRLSALFRTFVILALIHSIIGVFQYYQIAFTELPGNFTPYGLMANRNLYGSAQALLLPFCLYIFFTGNRLWKLITACTLVLVLTSIILSQTRSAWLASALVIFGSLLLVLIFTPKFRRPWFLSTLGIMFTAALLILLLAAGKDSTLARSLTERTGSIARPLSLDDTSSAAKNVNERIIIWNKTLQLIKDHPATGIGPGNWKIGIQAYGNKGLVNEYGNYVLDHAHNIYLQLAAEVGLPGLFFFLTFLILVAFVAFKVLKKANVTENDKIVVILSLCGIAAFAVDGLFSFPLERIEHTFYLFLFAGITLGTYAKNLEKSKHIFLSSQKWLWAPLTISILILFVSKSKFDFEIHAYRTKAFNKTNSYQEMINEVDESKTPFASLDINGDPLQMYSAIAYKELKNYDMALKECNKALQQHPYSARVYNTLGTIYTEKQNFLQAAGAYKKALAITSKADVTLKNLAVAYFNLKQYSLCLNILAQIKDVDKEPVLMQIKNACVQATGIK